MRHGSTLALVASCWLALSTDPVRAGEGAGPWFSPTGSWTLPDWSQGFRVAPILLLSRADVQTDLRMKPDQVADAARVIADTRRKATSLTGRSDQDVVALRRAVDEEQRTWLETKLTEDQVERLSQIDLRWEGVAAIASRPAVGEALSLSEPQKSAVGQALAERTRQRHKPDDRKRDPAAVENHFLEQVWATLDDGQRRRWEKMLGRPFAMVVASLDHGSRRSLR